MHHLIDFLFHATATCTEIHRAKEYDPCCDIVSTRETCVWAAFVSRVERLARPGGQVASGLGPNHLLILAGPPSHLAT